MFLKRLYREWRPLFYLLCLCMAGQIFFMLKGVSNVPFFLYYMYAQEHPKRDSVSVYLVKTDAGYFNHRKLSGREQEMLMNTVSYYDKLSKNEDGIKQTINKRFSSIFSQNVLQFLYRNLYNDSTALKKFPAWWLKYFKQVAKPLPQTNSITVVKSYMYLQYPYKKAPTDSILFKLEL